MFEPKKRYAVIELIVIKGGRRVLACSDTTDQEEDAVERAQLRAAEAGNAGQDRYFGVIPITWIQQC